MTIADREVGRAAQRLVEELQGIGDFGEEALQCFPFTKKKSLLIGKKAHGHSAKLIPAQKLYLQHLGGMKQVILVAKSLFPKSQM